MFSHFLRKVIPFGRWAPAAGVKPVTLGARTWHLTTDADTALGPAGPDFDRWLAGLARPAAAADAAGREAFAAQGCDGCHAVRGHFEGSPIGPDLTHFASRRSLAAGAVALERDALVAFVRDPSALKPGALMPGFPGIPDGDAEALADYLLALE